MTEEQGPVETAAAVSDEANDSAEDRDLPSSYCNEMHVAISLSDIRITLSRVVGGPQQHVFLSFNTAKTLAQSLLEIIGGLEAATNVEISTMAEVHAALFNESQRTESKEQEE